MDDNFNLRTATGEEINRRMALGVYEALREHKRAGNSIVVWDREKNEVKLLPPEEIELPPEYDVEPGPRILVGPRDSNSNNGQHSDSAPPAARNES